MTRTFCDRCGIELVDVPFRVTTKIGERPGVVHDLCSRCYEALVDWLSCPTTATANAHHDPRLSSMDCACVACEAWRQRNL